ncbi:hypothetical protein QE152_g33341 [Popillia japonica]|uniref:Uncharacterized protein n=1 Tax=Popillia japonica TaxID=7064 RepID=A0AAW1IXF7_POPJA
MKDLGSGNLTYLGISIVKRPDYILIDQSRYLKNVLRRYGMEDCKPTQSPMDVNLKFSETDIVDETYEKGTLDYKLKYINDGRSVPLVGALKRILRYIKGTLDYKLKYINDGRSVPLVGYADAHWARDYDRKSNLQQVIYLKYITIQLYGNPENKRQ